MYKPSAVIDISKASFLSRGLVSMTCSQITYRAVTSEQAECPRLKEKC